MTDHPSQFQILLRTAQGRIISALLILALLLGIVAEGVSILTGIYSMQKTRAERDIIELEARAKTATLPSRYSGPKYSHLLKVTPSPGSALTSEDCRTQLPQQDATAKDIQTCSRDVLEAKAHGTPLPEWHN